MLTKILSISGKPGLYQFVSHGNRMLIVETLDSAKKRMPVLSTEKVVALSDISIYTNDDREVPLASVFQNIYKEYQEKAVELSAKKASQDEIITFFQKALPNYDTDRVRVSDMRKVLSWYNILVGEGLTNFELKKPEERQEESQD